MTAMHDMVEHECVADHCVACCPVARSYSDGWESAKRIYSIPTPSLIHSVDATQVMIGIMLVMFAVFAWKAIHISRERLEHELSGQ